MSEEFKTIKQIQEEIAQTHRELTDVNLEFENSKTTNVETENELDTVSDNEGGDMPTMKIGDDFDHLRFEKVQNENTESTEVVEEIKPQELSPEEQERKTELESIVAKRIADHLEKKKALDIKIARLAEIQNQKREAIKDQEPDVTEMTFETVSNNGEKEIEIKTPESEEDLRMLYIEDLNERKERSLLEDRLEIHQVKDGETVSWIGYYYKDGVLSGKSDYEIDRDSEMIEAETKESVIELINKRYQNEKWTPIKSMKEFKAIGDKRKAELEKLKNTPLKKSWGKVKDSTKREREAEIEKIDKKYDLELHEFKYPFTYKAYDKINPSVRFFNRDFRFVRNDEGEADPKNSLGSWQFTKFKKINDKEGFFEYNFLGFYMVLKNSEEVTTEEKKIEAESPKAIYKVIGPDGSILIDNVSYDAARQVFEQDAEEYKQKLEEEFAREENKNNNTSSEEDMDA